MRKMASLRAGAKAVWKFFELNKPLSRKTACLRSGKALLMTQRPVIKSKPDRREFRLKDETTSARNSAQRRARIASLNDLPENRELRVAFLTKTGGLVRPLDRRAAPAGLARTRALNNPRNHGGFRVLCWW